MRFQHPCLFMDAPFGHICRVSIYSESNETKHLAAFKIAIAFSSLTTPVSGSCWQPRESGVMWGVGAL